MEENNGVSSKIYSDNEIIPQGWLEIVLEWEKETGYLNAKTFTGIFDTPRADEFSKGCFQGQSEAGRAVR
jgi:hypothetical protein